jgi:hypothetical protein
MKNHLPTSEKYRGDLMRRMADVHVQIDDLRRTHPLGSEETRRKLELLLGELRRKVYGEAYL